MKIGQNDIYLTDTGADKPALLLVHGIMMDHSVWEHQVSAFETTHRVVSIDLRGFGASSSTSPNITFDDHCDDILEIIDTLGLRNTTLVGWSMGGAIAQVLAARNENKIQKFVLVDTTPQLIASEAFPHALPLEAAQQLGKLLAEDFEQGCAAFCELIAPEDDSVAGQLTKIAARTNIDVAMSAFGSSGGRTQLSILPQIKTPTAVICGRDDAICLPAANEIMASTIPGCSTGVHWIEDSGHAPFLTKPDQFNQVLRSVL